MPISSHKRKQHYYNSTSTASDNSIDEVELTKRYKYRRDKISNFTDNLLACVKEKRDAYLGVAIIFVILYHASVYADSIKFLYLFIKGSIGVDIFLFLSGLGLCYSYNKNTKVKFYINRFLRVYPLFFLFVIVRSLIDISNGSQISALDWICNLTTLSYYHLGGFFTDWYICALILLYLCFPMLYKISSWQSVLIVTAIIVGFFWIIGRPYWTYECLIARIPIFMTGILAYKQPDKLWIAIVGQLACSPIAVLIIKSSPFATCTLAFLLIICCYYFFQHIENLPIIEKILSFMGQHSLELYLGNCLSMIVSQPSFIKNDYLAFIWMMGSTATYAGIFTFMNKAIKLLRLKINF